MVGAIKQQGIRRVGSKVIVRNVTTTKTGIVKWTGFMKQEYLNWWRERSTLTPVEIPVEAFTIDEVSFVVPEKCLLGYIIDKDIIVDGNIVASAGDLRLLTRRSGNPFETSLHPRWPIARQLKNRKIFFFQPWDREGEEGKKKSEQQ